MIVDHRWENIRDGVDPCYNEAEVCLWREQFVICRDQDKEVEHTKENAYHAKYNINFVISDSFAHTYGY